MIGTISPLIINEYNEFSTQNRVFTNERWNVRQAIHYARILRLVDVLYFHQLLVILSGNGDGFFQKLVIGINQYRFL